MRSCLIALLIAIILLGIIIGVGALSMGQMRAGLCAEQVGRVLLSVVGGGLLVGLVFVALLALVNFELLEKSLSGGQVIFIAASLTTIGLALASFFTVQAAHERCPRAGKAQTLEQVCLSPSSTATDQSRPNLSLDGQAQLAALSPASSTSLKTLFNPQRLVILGEEGQAIPWTENARRDWDPADPSETALVVCAGEPQQVRLETCRYGGGISINRYRELVAVRLVEAQSGRTLVTTRLNGEPPPCTPLGIQDLFRLRGKVQYEDVKSWVERVIAGEPPPGATSAPPQPQASATAQPTPTLTPSPSPTPVLEGVVKTGARLRGGPSKSDVVITGLLKGEVVQILGANSDRTWLNIIAPSGERGWIFGELLKLTTALEQIPLIP